MTEDEVKAIEHEIMMNEELISRDEVITLIARKHLSKEENFHGAITRLNRQVKALKTITIKAELAEVLDKISAEIDEAYREAEKEHCDLAYLDGLASVGEILEKYKKEGAE